MSKLRCPNILCRSTDIEVMGNDRKGFSIGKAALGGALTGGIGLLAGFAGKKGKYDCYCRACGKRFQTK